MKISTLVPALLLVTILITLSHFQPIYAAGQTPEYLPYHEPQSAGSSWLSVLAYLFTLLITFLIVVALAFFTSRYLGLRMGRATVVGDNKVILSLPLGPNRGVSVVQIAGKFLILGVTDHNINLLQEITDPAEADKLKNNPGVAVTQFDTIFQKQLASLQQMSQKFPGVFGGYGRNENDHEKR